jgi:hypothetical protein
MKANLMKIVKTLIAAAALSVAAVAPLTASAADVEVLNEGFSNVPSLPGWARVNRSDPAGIQWFQGNTGIFDAPAGAANSYAAVSYLSTSSINGKVDNWLITPVLSLSGANTLSFFSRIDEDLGFLNKLEVRFASGSTADPDSFTTLLYTLGSADFMTEWTKYSTTFDFTGTGRLAFRYFGDDASNLSYVGVDSVQVMTAVPEPSLSLMLGLGLGALGLLRRKQSN